LVASPQEVPSRPNVRIAVIGLVFLALFATMVLRLWSLQIIGQKSATAAVNQNQVRTVSVAAARGQILDRDDRVLVGNQVEQQIVLSRTEAADDPGIVAKVAALVGQTPAQISNALRNSQFNAYQPVPVLTGAPMATIQYLDEHQAEFPGVSVEQATVRSYPEGPTTATHVLGYVGAISAAELKENPGAGYQPSSQVGQSGLEHQYEQYLKGVDGKDELSVNAQQQVVGTLAKSPPQEGDILVTNLDADLQQTLQADIAADVATDRHTLDKTTNLYPAATEAAGIVMNVDTGAVLAMASYPTYPLTDWVGGISDATYAGLSAGCTSTSSSLGCPLDNNAIQGLYIPGSTFKLATATAALNDGLIAPNTYIDDSGTFNVPGCNTSGGVGAGCKFYDDDTTTGQGDVNVSTALSVSDDYFFYDLGDLFYNQSSKYGETPIQNVADEYGLDQVTGIDLPDEAQGRVDSQPERELLHKESPTGFPNTTWYAGDNIEMAFGQGGTVITPIELADAYATFANGGTRYQPQIGAALVDPTNDKVVKRFTPKVTGHVSLPPATYSAILQGLEGVVVSGTAAATFQQYAHFSLGQFQIAGKTGTADTAPSQITNGTDEPNAWFVAFGPEPNPEYVVLVVVNHGGYGAQAAAPAVMNVFNYLVTNPVGAVELPTPAAPPSNTPLPSNPPAGTAVPTTTTTTAPRAGG
jgi:penicillin-binding protein 2